MNYVMNHDPKREFGDDREKRRIAKKLKKLDDKRQYEKLLKQTNPTGFYNKSLELDKFEQAEELAQKK